jgi:hypothetical protein
MYIVFPSTIVVHFEFVLNWIEHIFEFEIWLVFFVTKILWVASQLTDIGLTKIDTRGEGVAVQYNVKNKLPIFFPQLLIWLFIMICVLIMDWKSFTSISSSYYRNRTFWSRTNKCTSDFKKPNKMMLFYTHKKSTPSWLEWCLTYKRYALQN